MDMDRLREREKEEGVKELWKGQLSPEVKEAWQRAKEALGEGKRECLKATPAT